MTVNEMIRRDELLNKMFNETATFEEYVELNNLNRMVEEEKENFYYSQMAKRELEEQEYYNSIR